MLWPIETSFGKPLKESMDTFEQIQDLFGEKMQNAHLTKGWVGSTGLWGKRHIQARTVMMSFYWMSNIKNSGSLKGLVLFNKGFLNPCHVPRAWQ